MATLMRVPALAAGATEVLVSEWLVGEHVPFKVGDAIAVIETDKASVEVEAETEAMVLRVLVPEGTGVEVGAPIALIGDETEREADLDGILRELGVATGSVTETVPESASDSESDSEEVAETASGAVTGAVTETRTDQAEHGRVFSSPLARRILKDAGLTTDQVRGSGPNGRIIRRDVERAVQEARATAKATPTTAPEAPASVATSEPAPAPASEPAVPQPATGGAEGAPFVEVPHTRQRRAIAARLTLSKQTVPHFYLKRSADIGPLLALREQLNEVSDQRISVNDLVIRAVAAAHSKVPDANVIWTDTGMRKFQSVDVAVAISSERGLVTPVLRGVEQASPSAIATRVRDYVRRADEGKLRQGELEGGSISATNLGMYGVEEFAAIINPPHSAILAVGAGRPTPVAVGETVQVKTQVPLFLSVDHRAIDGALAAQWMDVLVKALEEPLRLVA